MLLLCSNHFLLAHKAFKQTRLQNSNSLTETKTSFMHNQQPSLSSLLKSFISSSFWALSSTGLKQKYHPNHWGSSWGRMFKGPTTVHMLVHPWDSKRRLQVSSKQTICETTLQTKTTKCGSTPHMNMQEICEFHIRVSFLLHLSMSCTADHQYLLCSQW